MRTPDIDKHQRRLTDGQRQFTLDKLEIGLNRRDIQIGVDTVVTAGKGEEHW